ncbi:RbsD/FucU family protein [Wenxinia marina]|uniref:Fucose dissimilation pathway protein FucU n=1 Tax=Wenxinia marina DSM 24838 TaxID=1123501 RepID=A0A0D0QDC0_9RHOB|nr:RbsD/FucU domain-containing protein [Wenxinia marina]KIQ70317.1 Fucose dissimilation pathway protein FucU [Wenxinia marina DSM 24838]GGL54064.1 RbsD or FucU transporter [Wenxinia marina]
MLKGIDPLLNADVLWALGAMGHGDAIVLVDANFPGESVARATVSGRLLRIDADVDRAVRAVLSLMPLDGFVEDFAATMAPVDASIGVPPAVAAIQAEVDRAEGGSRPVPTVERFAFYDLAKGAFAIVQTAERRLYGNVMLRKGVIGPEE